MAAAAVIIHRIPGRVRLRVDGRRGDAAYFSELSQRLAQLDQVHGAKANPVTASVTLQFAGSLENVLRRAREEDLLTVADAGNGHGRAPLQTGWPAPETFAFPAKADEPVNLVSGRDINQEFMQGSMWLLIGMVQVLRRRLFPPTFTALWYAKESFRRTHERR